MEEISLIASKSSKSKEEEDFIMHDHKKTPVFTAMKDYLDRNVIPFDVPGHKYGRGAEELVAFYGEKTVSKDFNSMKPLDILSDPTSTIIFEDVI